MKQVVPFLTQRVAMVSGGDACGVICLGAALRESEQLQTPKSKRRKHLTFGALLEVEMSKKCRPLCREARSQNYAQNTPTSEHFWKLRCRKSGRRCGAKRVSKSKCTKHTNVGAPLEVAMSRSGRRCGQKHISKSKCTKHTNVGAPFEVAMSKSGRHGVARSTFPSQNVQSTPTSEHLRKLRCRKSGHHFGAKHISKSKCTSTKCSDHF